MEIAINQTLTWQLAKDATENSIPAQIKETKPQWFRNLPGNLKELDLSGHSTDDLKSLEGHGFRSAKFCLGLKGIRTLGWTIPTQHEINGHYGDGNQISYRQSFLHPEMLHGTPWCTKTQHNRHVWTIKIISFPCRAKLPQGFRLLITSYPLDWSPDWFCFSGCVDANYQVSDSRNIGSIWDFEEVIDPDYNYYNVELVLAIKEKDVKIPPGSLIFSMIPVWDPDYIPALFKGYPSF
jgi:hypothetical protein